MIRETLTALLNGSRYASAVMPWGKPAPIILPTEPGELARLVDAHICGAPADVTYAPRGRQPEPVRVDPFVLAGFCPAADGCCRFVAIDLDASDHGGGGLSDPAHALRCIAERAAAAGLLEALLVARSRRGAGRHCWLLLPEPTPLVDAVIGAAALIAMAFRIAAQDVAEADGAHAFRSAAGGIAEPGQPGAVEIIPRSSARPALGWSLTLPGAGAFAPRGGGIIIDPFSGEPTELDRVPRCRPERWARFIEEAREELARRDARRHAQKSATMPAIERNAPRTPDRSAAPKLDARTTEFLAGRVEQGRRNVAAFAAACNLLGTGTHVDATERMVLQGATLCALPAHEARAAVASAVGCLRRRGKLT
ncbi:hypothetical protein RAS1_03530 [Phycisphaerae bacterium RAS1]|nr:hypothetical protein RAS1_03530 [Phycisphaerae bacterium RAS1]